MTNSKFNLPNLDGIKMNVIQTAGNGVVNQATIFSFAQSSNKVSAHYQGGGITKGFLAGRLYDNQLHFKYAQEHLDGNIAGGSSTCDISRLSTGKIQLIENFDWAQGKGQNIFLEL